MDCIVGRIIGEIVEGLLLVMVRRFRTLVGFREGRSLGSVGQ